ncbi:MAG: DNA polymerase III subunit beta, partial [Microcystaceae cyanobacterium]
MKFICSQSDLNTNLSFVSRAVASRPTHPVLGNVLLVADAEKQQVSLTGFDLSLGIYTSFSAEVTTGGITTLPAKLLNDIVSRLPEGEITLEVGIDSSDEEENGLATLTSASGRFQVRSMSAAEFPALPVTETTEALMLPVSAFIEGLRGVLFAASTDETKQILTGVHVTGSQDSLEFAATDGHRLAVVETSLENSEFRLRSKSLGDIPNSEFSITIPARALRELERMLSTCQDTDSVALYVDEGQVIFELGDQRLTSRKLEGAYPAYEQLIPRTFSKTVTMERKRLLSSLDLVSVLADQKNNLVKFSLDSAQGQLSLSVDAQDLGSAMAPITADITGESTEIAFNVKYLMDGLKALSTSEIQMQLNEGNQPVIFTPLG